MTRGLEPALRALAELRAAELERAKEGFALGERRRALAEEETARARAALEAHRAATRALVGAVTAEPVSGAELARAAAFRARRREEEREPCSRLERAIAAEVDAERALDHARRALGEALAARELVGREEARRHRAAAARDDARLEDELADDETAKRARR